MEHRGSNRAFAPPGPAAFGITRTRRAPALGVLALALACGESGTAPDIAFDVVAVTPAADAPAAPVVGSIVARFSEALDPATIDGAMALDDAGREYRGQLVLRDAASLEFVPSDPLDFGTSYRVVVRSSVRSRSGARIAGERAWSFRTQGATPRAVERDSMRAWLRTLADDSMMGRRAGSLWELRAAEYLASRLEGWGLAPLLATLISPSGWSNVLAVVPGSGSLASEWVIVGAHFDALGFVTDANGTAIVRNGADDNASGTSLMLELARLYSRQVSLGGTAGVPRRAVLFAGFAAEERGLDGSREFAGSNAIPPGQIAAMVNFDMVGRLRNNAVAADNGGSARWEAMLANTNASDLLIDLRTVCKGCSDHASFSALGVPHLWFYTGTHPDYHTPQDDEHLINYDGMSAIGDMAYRILLRLAVDPVRPAAGAPPATTTRTRSP